MTERLKENEFEPASHETIQFRVDAVNSGKLYDFNHIEIRFSDSAFNPILEQREILRRYFKLKSPETPFEESIRKEHVLKIISPREKLVDKSRFSVYSQQLIEQIWNATELEHEYPEKFLDTETEILLLASLLDSNPEAQSRKLFRCHMARFGFTGQDDIGLLQQGFTLLEQEHNFAQRVQQNIEDNPEVVAENLRYETIYGIEIESVLKLATASIGLTEQEKRFLVKRGREIGLVSFDKNHLQEEPIILQWNIERTAFFADLLKMKRIKTKGINDQRLVRYLALLHNVDIAPESFVEERTALLDKIDQISSVQLVELGHRNIAFLLSLGVEILSRADSPKTQEEQRILDSVDALQRLGFTFIHEAMDTGEVHDMNRIHGGLRVENGKVVRDLCPNHTPTQVEEMKLEMQSMVDSVMQRNAEYLKQNEIIERIPNNVGEPHPVVGGELRKAQTEVVTSPPKSPAESLNVETNTPIRVFTVILPFVFLKSEIGVRQARSTEEIPSIPLTSFPESSIQEGLPSDVQLGVNRGVISLGLLRSVPIQLRETVQQPLQSVGSRAKRERVSPVFSPAIQSTRPVISFSEALQMLDTNTQQQETVPSRPLVESIENVSEIASNPIIPELLASSIPDTIGPNGNEGLALEVPKLQSRLVVGEGGGGVAKEFRIQNSELRIKGTQTTGRRLETVAAVTVQEEAQATEEVVEPVVVQAEMGTYEKGRSDHIPQIPKKAVKKPLLRIVGEEKPEELRHVRSIEKPTGRLHASKVISYFDPHAFQYVGRETLRHVA